MIRTVRRWAGAVALGAFALVAVGRLVGDLHLGGALGLCVTASALLLLRVRRDHPDRMTGDTWADKRWTGVSNGVVIVAALAGSLGATGPERFGLLTVPLATGVVGYVAGSLAEMDRDAARRDDESASAAPADA